MSNQLVVVYVLLGISSRLVVAADDPLQRHTESGTVEGFGDDKHGLWCWRGIPYAKPPIGDLRWRAPQAPEPWQGIRPAKEFPPGCIQPKLAPPLTILPDVAGSEDCLYLTVYRPQTAEEDLPVYFWIHGGGNIFGSAEGWYVEDLVRKANIVLVEVQYRLGVLGYFTHPVLRSGASAAEDSGNFGTLDQIKALQWVKTNIAAFGGNPFNVTIGGHSAGGHNVAQLMISPLARGLFHRAVNQSGGWLAQTVACIDRTANRTIEKVLTRRGLAKGTQDAQQVIREMADSELGSFLRGVPASELVRDHFSGEANPVWSFVIQDGVVIPGPLLRVLESGQYARVPTIIGVTETECGFDNITVGPQYPGMLDYRALLQVVEGKQKLDEVLPTPNDREQWLKARYYGSLFCRALVDETAKRLASWQDNVYVYSFNWGSERVCPETLAFTFGAGHCMELPFIFGNVEREPLWTAFSPMFTGFREANRPGRVALSHAMVKYLAQFLRTGSPNSAQGNVPEWKAWSNHAGGPKTLQLDADCQEARIIMDSQEVSVGGVRRALDAESVDTRRHVLAVVSVVQPFVVYEPGDYYQGFGR